MPAVREWGLREYPEALAEMRELRRARAHGAIPDTLLLTEHPPVVTVGVQGPDLPLVGLGIPVHPVERGGKSTYHGPGQIVGYPIVDLAPRGRDVRRFVSDLEELLRRALAEVGVAAGRREGHRGVWVDGTRKIASIGIAVEQWVTFHGFALNVDLDLAPFERIRPCGFDGRIMTSVARELGRPVAVSELTPPVVAAWESIFGGAALPLSEGSPEVTAPAP